MTLFTRRCAAAALSFAVLGAARAAEPAPLCLRAPSDAPVVLHGMPNFDRAGGGAQNMVYPVYGLAGAVAALATHAVLVNSARNGEKERLATEADAMLVPFKESLARVKHHELVRASLDNLGGAGAKRVAPAGTAPLAGETLVDSEPLFFMTPDQRAIVLDNTVTVLAQGAATPYLKTVRVVSSAQPVETSAASWFEQREHLLRQVGARMLAQSVDIALADMQAGGAGTEPFRTVRYPEGGAERVERAQVVREDCRGMVLRTLRGNLMAVPRAQEGEQACAL